MHRPAPGRAHTWWIARPDLEGNQTITALRCWASGSFAVQHNKRAVFGRIGGRRRKDRSRRDLLGGERATNAAELITVEEISLPVRAKGENQRLLSGIRISG